jgi:hypothetical protein
MATSIARNFPHEYLLKLLSLFVTVHAPLTSFASALDGRRGYPIWGWIDKRTTEVVRQLCTNLSRESPFYNFDMTLIGLVVIDRQYPTRV